MKTDRNLLSGSTPMLVLSLLRDGDKYGYQMVTELARRSDDTFCLREGTLYPLLHTLEKDGLVRAYLQKTDSGRERRYYSLTGEGLRELEQREADWKLFSEKVNTVLNFG